jgi:hypothetical protein
LIAPIAAAQKNPPLTTERVLVPVLARSVPGAFGSIWLTEFSLLNNNSTKAQIEYPHECPGQCDPQVSVESGAFRDITNATMPGSGAPGVFLYVPVDVGPLMEYSLRVRDLALQVNSFGTEIPVVREANALSRPFNLLSVPIDDRFRHVLRVYDFTGLPGMVRVEYLSIPGGAVLSQLNLPLFGETGRGANGPSYPAFGHLSKPRDISGVERVRIRVTPLDQTQRLWAFVTVTNNNTQELTVVSPQQ